MLNKGIMLQSSDRRVVCETLPAFSKGFLGCLLAKSPIFPFVPCGRLISSVSIRDHSCVSQRGASFRTQGIEALLIPARLFGLGQRTSTIRMTIRLSLKTLSILIMLGTINVRLKS